MVNRMNGDKKRVARKKEEEEKKRISPKLEIGNPNDKHEQEADAVAQKVVYGNGVNDGVSLSTNVSPNVQMKEEENGTLMAKSEDGTLHATDNLQTTLDSTKGTGQPLDEKTQSEMGPKMNADLSDVKIHTDSKAHEMSEGINAKAFTQGQDIYFKQGNFDTTSNQGKELLAHELAHTQQQGDGVERKIQKKDDPTKKTDGDALHVDQTSITTKANLFIEDQAFKQKVEADRDKLNDQFTGFVNDEKTKKEKAPAQQIPKENQILEQLDAQLDDPKQMYYAIGELDKLGSPGWGMLLAAAYQKTKKPENAFEESQAEVYGQADNVTVRSAIKFKFSQWLKEGKPGFLKFLTDLAALQNTILSDFAVSVLADNKLSSLVDKTGYQEGLVSKLHQIEANMNALILDDDPNEELVFNKKVFLKELYAFIPTISKKSVAELGAMGANISEILDYLALTKSLYGYAKRSNDQAYGKSSAPTIPSTIAALPASKNPNVSQESSWKSPGYMMPFDQKQQEPKASLPIVAATSSGQMSDIRRTATLLSMGFYTDEKRVKAFTMVKNQLSGFKRTSRKDLNKAYINQVAFYFLELQGNVKQLSSGLLLTLPGSVDMLNRLNYYNIHFKAVAEFLPTLENLAQDNPAAFFSMINALMGEIPRAQVELQIIGLAGRINKAWDGYDVSWMASYYSVMKVIDYSAEIMNADIEVRKLLMSHWFEDCSKLFQRAATQDPASVSKDFSKLNENAFLNARLADYAEFAEEEALFESIVKFVAAVIITIVAIEVAAAAAGAIIAEIGVATEAGVTVAGSTTLATVISTGINSTVFTTVNALLNTIVMQENGFANFGEDLVKNFIMFGALGLAGKGFNTLAKVEPGVNPGLLVKAGGELVTLGTLQAVDYSFYVADNFNKKLEAWPEYNLQERLISNVKFIIGLKVGMLARSAFPATLDLGPIPADINAQMEFKGNELNTKLKALERRDLSPEEQADYIRDSRTLLELRLKVVDDALQSEKYKKPENENVQKQKDNLKDLKTRMKGKMDLLTQTEFSEFNVRVDESNPDLSFFEGEPAGLGSLLMKNVPGAKWMRSGYDKNTYTLTTPKGTKTYIDVRGKEEHQVNGRKLASDQGFDWDAAKQEFWESAGYPDLAKDLSADQFIIDAYINGWRPGTGSKIAPDVIEKIKRQIGAENAVPIEQHFGKEGAGLLKKPGAFEQLTPDKLNKLLQQIPDVKSANRLTDRIEDLSKVQNPAFVEGYMVVDGKTYIDNAPLIDNEPLAQKVKNNPEQSASINKSLSTLSGAEQLKLQVDLNNLKGNGLNLFTQLNDSGLSKVSAQEQLTRAAKGEENGYTTAKQTVDYFEADKIIQSINNDKVSQDLLNTKVKSGKFKTKKEFKYKAEKDKLDHAKENLIKNPSESLAEIKEVQGKLNLDLSVKSLDEYLDKQNIKGNPFNDQGAYDLLVDSANKFIESTGKDVNDFIERLKKDGVLSRNNAKDPDVLNDVAEAFKEAQTGEKSTKSRVIYESFESNKEGDKREREKEKWKKKELNRLNNVTFENYIEELFKRNEIEDIEKNRETVSNVLNSGIADRLSLFRLMESASTEGVTTIDVLDKLDKLSNPEGNQPEGRNRVIGELVAGGNKFKGMWWTLEYIDAKGMWDQVEGYEMRDDSLGEDEIRRYDVRFSEGRYYQFKNIQKWDKKAFTKQFTQDIKIVTLENITNGKLKWIFKNGTGLGTYEVIKAKMMDAIKNIEVLTDVERQELIDNVDNILIVGL